MTTAKSKRCIVCGDQDSETAPALERLVCSVTRELVALAGSRGVQ